jgi:hypothetical protein
MPYLLQMKYSATAVEEAIIPKDGIMKHYFLTASENYNK